MTYWFVKIDGRWERPYTFYPVAKITGTKKNVEIYEVNLDELKKKNLVWKSEI